MECWEDMLGGGSSGFGRCIYSYSFFFLFFFLFLWDGSVVGSGLLSIHLSPRHFHL